MSKFLLIKIIGGFIAIAIVAGGISVWVKTHHSSVIVKEAEKILPARVNPLLKRSNEVYWFSESLYGLINSDSLGSFNLSSCYTKGGYIPNEDIKKELQKACNKETNKLMLVAKKHGYFKKSKLSDWLDQKLLEKVYEEHTYFSSHFNDDKPLNTPKKYQEPKKIKKEERKIWNKVLFPNRNREIK